MLELMIERICRMAEDLYTFSLPIKALWTMWEAVRSEDDESRLTYLPYHTFALSLRGEGQGNPLSFPVWDEVA